MKKFLYLWFYKHLTYKGRCYHIEPVPGEETQFIAYLKTKFVCSFDLS
jgi:hypothetical protein